MTKDEMPEICQRIVQVRMETTGPRGKASFSKLLGISPSTYEYYEAGRVPPAHILIKISEIANIDLRWLLTGQQPVPSGGADLESSRPILQRISALLDTSPAAIEALTAFLDILTETLEFPAKAESASEQVPHSQATGIATGLPVSQTEPSQPALSPEATGELTISPSSPPGTTAAPTQSPASKAQPSRSLIDDTTVIDDTVAGQDDLPPKTPPQRAGWLPVLGRSAAGVPQFWSAQDQQLALTTLDDLIARHVIAPASQTTPALALADQGDPSKPLSVQVVTLSDPAPGQPSQFLVAETIKNRYPDAFAVQIDGNSMSPEINHGDLVILSPSVAGEDGRASVIQLVGQIGVTCKLLRQTDELVHLIPINEQYAPQSFPAKNVIWSLRVLARVRP